MNSFIFSLFIEVIYSGYSQLRIIITLQKDCVGFGFRIVRATRESNECTAPTVSQTVVEHAPTPLSLLKLEMVVLLLEISCEPEGYETLSEVENLVHSGCRAQRAPLFLLLSKMVVMKFIQFIRGSSLCHK